MGTENSDEIKFNFYYDNIPLTDRVLEAIGFVKDGPNKTSGINCFSIDYPVQDRHFSLDDSFGYRWTGDSMNGHHPKWVLLTVGGLRKKHLEKMGIELDISNLKENFMFKNYTDPN